MAEVRSDFSDARDAMHCARQAYHAWSRCDLADRLRCMRALREAIAAQSEQIVADIVADTGKPPLDALGGDLLVTLEMLRYYERNAAAALKPKRIRSSPLFFCRSPL